MRALAGTLLIAACVLAAGPARASQEGCDDSDENQGALYRRIGELLSPGALVLGQPGRSRRIDPQGADAVSTLEAGEGILVTVSPESPLDGSPSVIQRRVRVTKEGGVTTARVSGFDPIPSFTARGWKDIRGVQQGEVDLPYGILLGGDFDRREGIRVGPRAEVEIVRVRLPSSEAELSASAGGSGTIRTDGTDLSGSVGPRTKIYLLIPVDQNGRRFTVDLSGGPEVDIRNRTPSPGGNATILLKGTF